MGSAAVRAVSGEGLSGTVLRARLGRRLVMVMVLIIKIIPVSCYPIS